MFSTFTATQNGKLLRIIDGERLAAGQKSCLALNQQQQNTECETDMKGNTVQLP